MDSEKNMRVLWGQIAADLMMERYDDAYEEFMKQKEHIDNMVNK